MIARKVVGNSALRIVLEIVTRLLDLVTLVILARLLTPEDFGLLALATAILMMARGLTQLPLMEALVQRRHVRRRDLDTAFTLGLARGLLVAAGMTALAYPIAAAYDDGRLAPVIMVLALAPAMTGVQSPMMAFQLRRVNYLPVSLAVAAGKLAGFIVAVLLALATQSYWALVVGLVVDPMVTVVLTYFMAPYRPRLGLASAREVLGFAGWVTVFRMVWTIGTQADRLFIAALIGKPQLGIYSVGRTLSTMATYAIANPVMQPLFAGFSRIKNEPDRLRAAYLRSQQVMMTLILPLGIGLALVAEPAVHVLLGPQWKEVVTVVIWVAPATAFQMLVVPTQPVTMALGRPRVLAEREMLSVLITVPMTVLGAWLWGIQGAAIGLALSGPPVIFIGLLIAQRLLGLPLGTQLRGCLRPLLGCLAMAMAVLGARTLVLVPAALPPILELMALIVIGALAYVGFLAVLWLARGRPDGAEAFLLSSAIGVWRAVRTRMRRRAPGRIRPTEPDDRS